MLIGWMSIDEIQNVTIYPEFIKKEIFRLNEPIKYFCFMIVNLPRRKNMLLHRKE